MTHNRTIRAALLLAIALALCLYFFGCDDDSPTGPVDPEPSGYKVYFYDNGDHPQYWSWHSGSGKLDTIMLPVQPYRHAAISPDGRTMFVTRRDLTVAVMDVASGSLVADLPYTAGNGIAVSPDGTLLALQDVDLTILTLPDFQVYYHDTIGVAGGVFSPYSRVFYCGVATGATACGYRLNLDDPTDVWQYDFSTDGLYLSVRCLVPSPDEHEYYAYGTTSSSDWFFAVYRVAADSVYFSDYLSPGYGEIAVDPESGCVAYTSPGYGIGFLPPLYEIRLFDAEAGEPAPAISTVLEVDGDTIDFAPDEVCFTPDGKWLLAITNVNSDVIVVVNAETLQIDHVIRLGGNHELSHLMCQTEQ